MRNAAPHRRNIALVGPMGSGKSHVGRLLATRLGCVFTDLDARIEAEAGMSIPAIFAAEGEPGFRARESQALAETLAQAGQVIATGGGAVLDAGNRTALRSDSHVIYLRVELAEQLRRLSGDTQRPLLAVADRAQRLSALQALREPLYREVASIVFETAMHSPEQVADALAMMLASNKEPQA